MAVVGDKPLVASWSEAGKVHIWDISHPLKAVNDPMVLKGYIENKESPRPLFTFKGILLTVKRQLRLKLLYKRGRFSFQDTQQRVSQLTGLRRCPVS